MSRNSTPSRAGLRACKCVERRGFDRLPVLPQWRYDRSELAYRCGGSAGLQPASRFTCSLTSEAPKRRAQFSGAGDGGQPNNSDSLFAIGAGADAFEIAVRVGLQRHFDRAAAHGAILDIAFRSFRRIGARLAHLAAIRAMDDDRFDHRYSRSPIGAVSTASTLSPVLRTAAGSKIITSA